MEMLEGNMMIEMGKRSREVEREEVLEEMENVEVDTSPIEH